jgi:hypothetical protein
MREMVSSGMPSRELKAWAAMNRKKIIGVQRMSVARVRALAVPALRWVKKLGFWNRPRKSATPSLAVKA